jgi:hypothetical protein
MGRKTRPNYSRAATPAQRPNSRIISTLEHFRSPRDFQYSDASVPRRCDHTPPHRFGVLHDMRVPAGRQFHRTRARPPAFLHLHRASSPPRLPAFLHLRYTSRRCGLRLQRANGLLHRSRDRSHQIHCGLSPMDLSRPSTPEWQAPRHRRALHQ